MAHFLGTDALDPVLDEVIGKGGLCPPETPAPRPLYRHAVAGDYYIAEHSGS
jgi:hypothetical protein